MANVYLLWHEYEFPKGQDNEKLVGVYESEAAVQAALDRVKDQPGFVDWPDGFKIECRAINADSWEEGFFTWTVPLATPDYVCSDMYPEPVGLTTAIPEGESLIRIEGSARALEFLSDLMSVMAKSKHFSEFTIGPHGAGNDHFSRASTVGISIHRTMDDETI